MAALPHAGNDSPDRPHVAHHVQLPHRVPLLVGNVGEVDLHGEADVVHEAVDPAERLLGLGDDSLWLPGLREVAGDAELRGRVGYARSQPGLRRGP